MIEPEDSLNEREFELINIVGSQLAANQRDISHHMKLSLGMTNMVLKRLITKGYIRIKQLDRRKVQYMLTPKGFAEKMQKSVKYTLKTINSIALIKKRLLVLLKAVYDDGVRTFYIWGGADLAGLIEITLNENFPHNFKLVHIEAMPQDSIEGAVLICREDFAAPGAGVRVVNVIEELAKDQALLGQEVQNG